MKLLLTTILTLSFSAVAFCQITYEKRQEFELKDGYENEKIREFGENGFIMWSKNEKKSGQDQEWKFELYNTDLELVKTEKVLLNKKYGVDETYSNKDHLHLLFRERKGDFSIVSINANNLEMRITEGEVPKKSRINDMAVYGDFAFFSASIKGEPYLFSVNWTNGEKKLISITLPEIKPKRTSLMGFQVIEDANQTFLYLKAIVDKRDSEIYILRINEDGKKEETVHLTQNIENNIIDITASQIEGNKYVFTGTYSSKFTSSSQGIYICQATGSEVDFINFYKFLDLENFLSYLPEKRQEKLEKKKKRKEAKGKELELNYRIASHGIITVDDGYLFLGEAYYPTYRTETYTTTTTNAQGVTTTQTQTRQVFDGYQYTHALLSKFNKKGELQWDQIFEMYSAYKPFFVKRFISLAEQKQNSIKLVFVSRNKIYSKSFDFEGEVLNDSESEEIETSFEGDISKRSFSNIDFWYDQYFIAYGQQVIKNKEKEDKRKRKVYFISKIKYE